MNAEEIQNETRATMTREMQSQLETSIKDIEVRTASVQLRKPTGKSKSFLEGVTAHLSQARRSMEWLPGSLGDCVLNISCAREKLGQAQLALHYETQQEKPKLQAIESLLTQLKTLAQQQHDALGPNMEATESKQDRDKYIQRVERNIETEDAWNNLTDLCNAFLLHGRVIESKLIRSYLNSARERLSQTATDGIMRSRYGHEKLCYQNAVGGLNEYKTGFSTPETVAMLIEASEFIERARQSRLIADEQQSAKKEN